MNVEGLLGDLQLSEKWHIPPWQVSGRDEATYKPIYRALASIYDEIKFEFDLEEYKEREREARGR